MDCLTASQQRFLELEEKRLEFERQKHEDIIALEYARLGIARKQKEAPTEDSVSLADILNYFMSDNRRNF